MDFRVHWASPYLRLPREPHSHCRHPGLPSPCLRLSPTSWCLHLGLPGHGCFPGVSASQLGLGLHHFRLILSQSVPKFHPDLQPKLHPGSSRRRLCRDISLYRLLLTSILAPCPPPKPPSLYCWIISYSSKMHLLGGGTTVTVMYSYFGVLCCFPVILMHLNPIKTAVFFFAGEIL